MSNDRSIEMTDVFSKRKRSTVMSAIRSNENKDTELRLIRLFKSADMKVWRRKQPLTGRPDFVFYASRVVVFVDGCFWHGCPVHGRRPTSNTRYWDDKLERNKKRDHIANRLLRADGWKVLRIWEHELSEPKAVIQKMRKALS